MRGRSRPAFPPSIHQWETGDAGVPGLGRVVAAAGGVAGGGGPEFALPSRVRGWQLPPLPARGARAHPWPSASQLGPWAVYGGDRAEPRLRGARVWAAAWRLPASGPEPQSQLGAVARVLQETEAEGAGLGPERDCTRGESGSPCKGAAIGRPERCRKPNPLVLAFRGLGGALPPARGLEGGDLSSACQPRAPIFSEAVRHRPLQGSSLPFCLPPVARFLNMLSLACCIPVGPAIPVGFPSLCRRWHSLPALAAAPPWCILSLFVASPHFPPRATFCTYPRTISRLFLQTLR